MIRERKSSLRGSQGAIRGGVPEESGGEERAGGLGGAWSRERAGSLEQTSMWSGRSLEQGASRELGADDWEQRQAREVWSQGSTQEITPAILSDSNRIVKRQVRTPKLRSYLGKKAPRSCAEMATDSKE